MTAANVLLDELDRELERRGHRFVRYADDCNIYVQSRSAGERVLVSVERFLRCILWRQWKRPKTRFRELVARGLAPDRAKTSSANGHGPWWNAGASHMNQAVPTAVLHRLGLVSLIQEHQRLARSP